MSLDAGDGIADPPEHSGLRSSQGLRVSQTALHAAPAKHRGRPRSAPAVDSGRARSHRSIRGRTCRAGDRSRKLSFEPLSAAFSELRERAANGPSAYGGTGWGGTVSRSGNCCSGPCCRLPAST